MKRYVLIIIIFIMFVPFMVNAEETLTITYDANDGSGRTKVVELEKGDTYTLLGTDTFKKFNDDKDDPMDDEVISRWTINPDNSDNGYAIYSSKSRTSTYPSVVRDWEFFNNQTELTLYAKWTKREDISDRLSSNIVTGDGVVQDENGEYSILDKKDFECSFSFKENSTKQINALSYYRLPKYFTDALPFYIKEELVDPSPLPIKIDDGGTYYTYVGSYYIKDDILYVDLINKGDYESNRLYASADIRISITYGLTWVEKEVNNRTIYSATISFNWNNSREPVEVFQKGKIITEFVEIDTDYELLDNEINTGVLGDLFIIEPREIEGYELVSYPDNVEFEDETQYIKYYYRKVNKTNDDKNIVNILTNPKTGNVSLIFVFVIITSLIVYIFYIKKRSYTKK